VRWIERFLVHGEGDFIGKPARLRPDQKLFLYQWQELEEVDGVTGWWYDGFYFEAPSGVGKTQEMAWLALEAFAGPSSSATGAAPNVIVQANSKDQAGEKRGDDSAEGIFGRIAQVCTHKNCPLRPFVRVLEDRIVFADDRPGRIRLIPARGATTDGGLPTLYLGDEVQDWSGQAADAWVRNRKGTTKTRMSRYGAGSTPGAYAGAGTIGWELHEDGERGDDPRFLYRKLAVPPDLDLRDEKAVRAALIEATPGIEEHRLERLVREARKLPRPVWMRFHGGLWVEADKESWLAEHPGAWERCEKPLTIPDGAEIGVGVDMGLKRDSMAVVWCARVDERIVARARIWTPEPGRPIDIAQARRFISGLDLEPQEGVEGRSLADRFNIRWVAYDPRYFAESAADLEDQGVALLEFPQSTERLAPADGHLYDLVLGETIAHDGDHDFGQHVNAAVKRTTERGWYLSKSRAKRPMDAVRALSMAVEALTVEAGASVLEGSLMA
jgi:phage terminase large subunit-like protein